MKATQLNLFGRYAPVGRLISGFYGAISFLTVIPAPYSGKDNSVWAFSVVGLIMGTIAGFLFYVSYFLVGPFPASAISISTLMLLSGLNHVDAVIDTGDALMARGNAERRREVIKDRYLGAGGLGSFFIIYGILLVTLPQFGALFGFAVIVLMETLSKFLMVVSLYESNIFSEGYAKTFRGQLYSDMTMNIFANLIPPLCVLVLYLPLLILPTLVTFALVYALKTQIESLFGGINGDIVGFLGELSKMFLVVLIVFEIHLLLILRVVAVYHAIPFFG